MQIHDTIESVRAARAQAGKVAFVPTMGNLHEGHIALMRQAGEHAVARVIAVPAWRTGDLGGPLGTKAFAARIVDAIRSPEDADDR